MDQLNLINLAIAATVSVFVALIGEAVNWYLIYRHEEYKKLQSNIFESQ